MGNTFFNLLFIFFNLMIYFIDIEDFVPNRNGFKCKKKRKLKVIGFSPIVWS